MIQLTDWKDAVQSYVERYFGRRLGSTTKTMPDRRQKL